MLFGRRNVSAGLFVSNRSYVYLALEGEGGSAKVVASAAGALPESAACGASLFSASAKELKDIFRFVSDAAKPARGGLNFAVPMNASLLRVASMPGLHATRRGRRSGMRWSVISRLTRRTASSTLTK